MSFAEKLIALPADTLAIPDADLDHPLDEAFRAFVKDVSFPCVGAKAALAKGQLRILVLPDMTRAEADTRLFSAMLAFIARYRSAPALFQSLAVIFEQPVAMSEEEFEAHLWRRLQRLSDHDRAIGHPWDERVAQAPDNPHFSMSVAKEAFFVVGLHPGASRPARRFVAPTMVFNLHDQFEQLRTAGRYEGLRESILERDMALAGSINPMLTRHGEMSEARQYSGRPVDEAWLCPFHAARGVKGEVGGAGRQPSKDDWIKVPEA